MIVTVTPNTAIDRTLEVPRFRVGGVQSAQLLSELPAGKGVNVSRCLSMLGVKSVATGFIGKGDERFFRSALRRSMVRCRFVTLDGRTRRDTTILDSVKHTETHVKETGFTVSRTDVRRLREALRTLCRKNDVVAFCGSVPPGMDPKELARLVRLCRETGARIALDASGETLRAAFLVGGFCLKPNRAELSELLGRKIRTTSRAARAGRELLAKFENVLISMGSEGAVLVTRDATWHANARVPPERVINTVGCGDVLVGGFLAGCVQGLSLQDCLRRAVACATTAAMNTATGVIDLKVFRKLQRAVSVKRLA